MAFLDRKEQVMDTQLTQYGKRLLAKGKFKPAYYAFYDDDIIYDLNWAGGDETQNSSEGRIKEAIRPDVQYVFSGIETKIKEQNKTLADNKHSLSPKDIQNEADAGFMVAPLGTSDPNSKYSPAWDIGFLEGNYTGSVSQTYKTGSLELKIPQLEVELEYKIKVAQGELPEGGNTESEPLMSEGEDDHDWFKFPDGTYHFLDTDRGDLFLRVLEKNTRFLNENYEIEVFAVNEDAELRKLSFIRDEITIKNDIFLDTPERIQIEDFGPDYVEYYFDLFVDEEIDNEDYCKVIQTQTLEDILTDKDVFKCDDVPSDIKASDIYRISKTIDEEPC